ncbi:MAG: hypothetical protein WD097_07705 [Balneolales bacterium]
MILSGGGDFATAQIYNNVYRPARPEWNQLQTPHFRILFQEGEESAAIQSAAILEEQYPLAQSLVGGSLTNMPVVLNGKNDLSNGYVTTLHFRIEVEIPRPKGKSSNPLDGNWLNSVMPHELVHALHLNVTPFPGVSWFIRYFSPDVARTMHFAAPLGLHEGVAVFHDTHHHYGISGRGNHPYFTHQYLAAFDSRNRWSLDQMLMAPTYSYPFDRHYIGGYEFIRWLQYRYGMETTRETIRFVSRWPFLGYGSALWYYTGVRPSILFRQYEKDQEETRSNTLQASTKPVLDKPFKSLANLSTQRPHRPFWISENTIIYYATSYNQRPGFYLFNIQSGNNELAFETGSVEDFVFDLHADRSRFLYARYHRHPYYHNYHRMMVHEAILENNDQKYNASEYEDNSRMRSHMSLNFSGQPVRSIERVHAPVYGPENTIWGLQSHHETNLIVRLKDWQTNHMELDTLLVPNQGHFVQIAFHPQHSDSLVLLANRDGLLGLWLLDQNYLAEFNERKPDIVFEKGSIYDPAWHPDGNRLLFTSDQNGTMNFYEYRLKESSLFQLTDHPYGIMEGQYSPKGNRLVGKQIRDNGFELVILEKDDLLDIRIPENKWEKPSFSGLSPSPIYQKKSGSENWNISSYQTGLKWLTPRSFFPYWKNESPYIGNRYGASFSGGDVLRRNRYLLDFSTSNNRFWYHLEYQYSGFYPGFQLNGYHQPLQTSDQFWEQQGIRLEIPFHYVFDHDTRTSSFTYIPGFDILRQRIIRTDGDVTGSWIQRIIVSQHVSYQHKLQQNIRDVQPNTGWLFFARTEWDLDSEFPAGKMRALRIGTYRYLSFQLKKNRSLRIGTEWITQNQPLYDISGFYSFGFYDHILSGINNASRWNTRYTIPVWHVDRGQILLPLFFDRFYVVVFSDTVVPLISNDLENLYHNSRTLIGGGLQLRMRIFNFPLDIGVTTAYEPTRGKVSFFMGSF